MISFGELRRLSVEWQSDIAAVERAYAIDWLLKGIFERQALKDAVALRGASALNKAYFADYPPVEDVELARDAGLDHATLPRELEDAAQEAARISGLRFRLHSMAGHSASGVEARFEYTGPLGRRSAAQPRLPVRFVASPLRAAAVTRALLHPFSDRCDVMVRATALEELAAERIATISGKPRARDVFDLWFILTRGAQQLDGVSTRVLAEEIAREKTMTLRAEFDPAYRPLLERAWENALKGVRGALSFKEVEQELHARLNELVRT